MLKVVRVLVYEYDTEERAANDREHWNIEPEGEVYPGAGKHITSTIIEHGDDHLVDVAGWHIWTIQHAIRCRPNLLDCPIHAAVDRYDPSTPGRFLVELDSTGEVAGLAPLDA